MSTSTSRPYHHGELRRALMDAAVDAATAAPDRALSLREVARRAGVSHAAAYNHFENKTALLRAIAAEGFEALEAVLRETAAQPEAGVADVAAGYVRFAMQRPFAFSLMFDRELCLPAGEPDVLEDLGRHAQEGLRDFLATRYTLREGVAEGAAFAALSMMHGVATLVLQTPAAHVTDAARAEAMARAAAAFLAFASAAD